MRKIRDWLNEPGSGLGVYLIVAAVLIVIIFINGLRSANFQKKAEARQYQLIAVCGAVNEALREAGIDEKDVNIFVRWPNEKGSSICIALNEGETAYTVNNGQLVIRKPGGVEGQIIKKTWEDYPGFHSLIKK